MTDDNLTKLNTGQHAAIILDETTYRIEQKCNAILMRNVHLYRSRQLTPMLAYGCIAEITSLQALTEGLKDDMQAGAQAREELVNATE